MVAISIFLITISHHFASSQSVSAIYHAGGLVEAGAHGQMQGVGIHWEIRMFAQGNMTYHEALKAATINSAKV